LGARLATRASWLVHPVGNATQLPSWFLVSPTPSMTFSGGAPIVAALVGVAILWIKAFGIGACTLDYRDGSTD